jgi:NAD(P)-dependent dehydrogenase (short-subunit alcohol dehydrogenase family)
MNRATPEIGSLRGRRVLITGAAKRIGREIALHMAAAGADVAITYLTSRQEAEATVKGMRQFGGRALALRCDVRDEKSVKQAAAAAIKALGGLDILINNAALYETVEIEDITVKQWDEMFNTNVRGPFLFSRACRPALRRSRGQIINIGSLGGMHPWTTHAHYCQSKAALHMQTKILAKAFAPEVAVNCVAPGMIDLREKPESEFLKRIAKKTPLRRNGTAAEVAHAVLLLASASHFTTGQVLVVDGGLGLTSF